MPRIVIATCNVFPELQSSDEVFADALRTRGVDVSVAPWNGDQAAFENADSVIIRSTWDYQEDPERFAGWIERLGVRTRLFNSPSLMRWNLSKRYLLTMQESGAPMAPLTFVEPEADAIAAAMDEMRLEIAVVKPEFGATASGLSLVRRDDARALEAAAAAMAMPGVVQAFVPEIAEAGETSFMFIDGEFTHAVTKRPKPGDIRCQAEFGGTTEAVMPPPWAVEAAALIHAGLPQAPLYARIDVILLDGRLQLMEVELIEPELFFTYCLKAAARLAAALIERL